MKKFVVICSLLIAGMVLMGQSVIIGSTAGTDQTKGTGSANIILPNFLNQEYDWSYQVIPALAGSGDSVNASVKLYQSNSYTYVWTEVTSARDTITSTDGVLIEGTNAPGLFHRITLTGISADTVSHQVNYVLKLDKQW